MNDFLPFDISKKVSVRFIQKDNCFRIFFYRPKSIYISSVDFSFDDFFNINNNANLTLKDLLSPGGNIHTYLLTLSNESDISSLCGRDYSIRITFLSVVAFFYDLTYTNLDRAFRINHKRAHSIQLNLKKNASRYLSFLKTGV